MQYPLLTILTGSRQTKTEPYPIGGPVWQITHQRVLAEWSKPRSERRTSCWQGETSHKRKFSWGFEHTTPPKLIRGSNLNQKTMFKTVHIDVPGHRSPMCQFVLFLFPLLLMVVYKGWEVGGVQVMEFQKDGVASWWTVAEYKNKLNRDRKMDSVTLCARFKLFFLHARGTFFHLQDQPLNLDSQLKGELWLDRVRPVIAHRWNFQPLDNKLRTYR